MPNLLLTDACNRSCPYCFAKRQLSRDGDGGAYLDLPGYTAVLDFMEKSSQRRLNLLGGEPTLHPQFPAFLRYALVRDVEPHVFTNAICSGARIAEIRAVLDDFEGRGGEQARFVVNLHDESIREPVEWERQQAFFASLGRWSSLSYNVYRTGQDFSFLADVIERFGLVRQIRVGLAQPVAGLPTSSLPLADYREVTSRLAEAADEFFRRKISFNLDCGFPLCLFTDAELGKMFREGMKLSFRCQPCLDIGTDLSVWHCFPLGGQERVPLADFPDLASLSAHFEKRFAAGERKGIFEKCDACPSRAAEVCHGGCKAHYLAPAGGDAAP